MVKKIKLKTAKSKLSVSAYLNSIEDPKLRKDSKTLLKIFKSVTGLKARMWGTSIIGFGEYTYSRSNGAVGEYMAVGFSARKSGPTIYIMPGYQNYSKLLKSLGPHKLGKSCLYLKNLDGINIDILEELIITGMRDLKKTHTTSY